MFLSALKVSEFHRVMGVSQPTTPIIPNEAIVRYRVRMLAEEFFELLDATFSQTNQSYAAMRAVMTHIEFSLLNLKPDEFFDALTDIAYINDGTWLEFGVDGEPVFELVHAANLAKAHVCQDCMGSGANGSLIGMCEPCGGHGRIVKKRADGKILKPDDWKPPDVLSELRRQGLAV